MYTLTDAQRRIVVSLAQERQRITVEANVALDEINQAEAALVEMLRQSTGLPGGEYRLQGNVQSVQLVLVEPEDKTENG